MSMTRSILAAGAVGLALTAAAPAHAQYPEKAISIVVSASPGSANDLLARFIADRLSPVLGQSIVVDNRPGGGTRIGAAYVANSPADGYTLMVHSTSMLTTQAIYNDPGYEVVDDFVPISQLARGAMGVIVRSDFPADDLRGFVDYAKANPGEINYGSAGVGSIMHLNAALLGLEADIEIEHIPYGGGAPTLTALLGNEVQMTVIDVSTVQSHVAEGTLKVLAVGSTERLPEMPDVPTMQESGVDMTATLWYGLLGPSGMPEDVLAKLRSTLAELVSNDDFVAAMRERGFQPPITDIAAFEKEIAGGAALWRRVVEEADIEKQ